MKVYEKIKCFEKTYKEYRDLLGHNVSEEEILPLIKQDFPNDTALVQWWYENQVLTPKSPFTHKGHNGLFS